MDLDGPVFVGEGAGGAGGPVGHGVGAQVVLEPAEHGVRRLVVLGVFGGWGRRRSGGDGEGALHLAHVAAEGGGERMADVLTGRVVLALGRAGVNDGRERAPGGGGGHRQPEMHFANVGDGGDQLELGDREPGVAEQREPVGERECGAAPDGGDSVAVTLDRGGSVDGCGDPAPQLRLPGQVGVDSVTRAVAVPSGRPVFEHPRSVTGIGAEEAREAVGDGPAPLLP